MSDLADLGAADGIEIVLDAVECKADRVTVRFHGRASALTERLDASYRAAFAAWEPLAIAAKQRGERAPDPPRQPGEMLNDVALIVSDDAGTGAPTRTRSEPTSSNTVEP
jgi:hypothetical protein